MSLKGKQADFKAVGTSVTDTYNLAGAIAVLYEFGLSAEQLKKSVEKLEIVKSRYDEEKIGDKQVIMSVAKGQNPVACSRVFSSIKNHTGKKAFQKEIFGLQKLTLLILCEQIFYVGIA